MPAECAGAKRHHEDTLDSGGPNFWLLFVPLSATKCIGRRATTHGDLSSDQSVQAVNIARHDKAQREEKKPVDQVQDGEVQRQPLHQ